MSYDGNELYDREGQALNAGGKKGEEKWKNGIKNKKRNKRERGIKKEEKWKQMEGRMGEERNV